jgi:hyperosmotically inducible periplasmic protein
MNMRRSSILLLCLAGACAHGKGSDQADRRGDQNRSERRAEARAESDDRGEIDGGRVEVPDSKKGRGRMASAGEELPADSDPSRSAAAYGTEPDNTRVNERDRQSGSLTPLDQSEEEDDRELTQSIRKSVMGEDSLSFTAKNVKIITREGQVTLRGSVKSNEERTTIERLATEAAGPGKVTNELEVAD